MSTDVQIIIDDSMVTNDQEYNIIKDEITCEICTCIVINPRQCDVCETVFCDKCIKAWLKKNNSCPKRCENFKIKEASKIIKKLLDKLNVSCFYCKKQFHYEEYINKHFKECYEQNLLIKCPLCKNCEIKKQTLDEYKKEILKENEMLYNEIKVLKEKINILEKEKNQQYRYIAEKPKIISEYRWNRVQNKNDFVLSYDQLTIRINYNSCYNYHYLDYIFKEKKIYTFGILIKNFTDNNQYNHIGFSNEKLTNYDCLCTQSSNCFYLRIDIKTLYEGKTAHLVTFDIKNILKFRFILNLIAQSLEVLDYDTNKSLGLINVIGTSFKFFVSKCNSGSLEYTILG